MLKIPYQKQENDYYCGPAVLSSLLGYFGKNLSQKEIAKLTKTKPPPHGTENHEMAKMSKKFGFYSKAKRNATIKDIEQILKKYPVIINYIEPEEDVGHFAIVLELTKNSIILSDPWHGPKFKITQEEFLKRWHNHKN